MNQLILIGLVLLAQNVISLVNRQDLKCLVCEKVMEEIQNEVNKLDPNVMVDAGGYRLDDKGNIKTKVVPQSRSEIQISDILDKICEKNMEDYVRVTSKTTGVLMLIKIVLSDGNMNPYMNQVDVIQDDDLNKSIPSICEVLLEEHEELVTKSFVENETVIHSKFCSTIAKYCPTTTEEYDNHQEL